MASSLDVLSKNLNEEQCKNFGKFYRGEQFTLLKQKGIYPYDYVNSVDKLSDTSFPPKYAFYSRLNEEAISDEDYKHAQKVWKEFNINSLREYHGLYNISDVLLLADVFENFRDVCMKNYNLDPAWNYTASGLACDASLKLTEVELELLSDIDMLRMVQQGIRCGVAMVSNRYGRSNNKYMSDKYDSSQPSKYISYLGANNLYGCAIE